MCCRFLQRVSHSVTVHKLVWLLSTEMYHWEEAESIRVQQAIWKRVIFKWKHLISGRASPCNISTDGQTPINTLAHKSVFRKCNYIKKRGPFCFQTARSLSDCVHNSSKKRPSDSAVSIEEQRNYCLESHSAVGIFCITLLKTAEMGGQDVRRSPVWFVALGRTTVLIWSALLMYVDTTERWNVVMSEPLRSYRDLL